MIKGVGNMTIAEHLEKNQPLIYNFLIDLFGLSIKKTDGIESVEDEILKAFELPKELFDSNECSTELRYYKAMMEKPRGVKL